MKKRYIALAVAVSIMASAFAQVLGVKGEKASSFGFYIKDLRAEKVIFESEADRALVPASITKSLTSASALLSLGANYRFKTSVDLSGRASASGVWTGNIVVNAVGDPTIESRHFTEARGFCDSIVAAVKRLGIKKINGDVVVLSKLSEPGQIAQWEIDDVAWGYGAGLYGFNYKDNTFTLWPATRRTVPYVPGLRLNVRYSADGTDVIRGINSDSLIVEGSNIRDKKWSVTSTMPDPTVVFRHELIQHLNDAGITLTAKVAKMDENTRLYTHLSPKLSDILRSLMLRSDNMFAEGVLRALAPDKSRREAIDVEKQIWFHLPVDQTVLLDGSGLSRADRFSPRFIGGMLETMSRTDVAETYVSLFPVAGESGTLKSFMADTRLAGRLAMKTGSMNGVQTYAGYLLDDEKKPTHVVVVMCNSFFCSRAELREAISAFLLKTL